MSNADRSGHPDPCGRCSGRDAPTLWRSATPDGGTAHPRPARSSAAAAWHRIFSRIMQISACFSSIGMKSRRFNTRSSQSSMAVAIAVRSSPSSIAISPKISPGMDMLKTISLPSGESELMLTVPRKHRHHALPGRPFGKDLAAGRIALDPRIARSVCRSRHGSIFRAGNVARRCVSFPRGSSRPCTLSLSRTQAPARACRSALPSRCGPPFDQAY